MPIMLPVPKAAWDYIAAACHASGRSDFLHTHDAAGLPTIGIPLDGIAIIPVGISDSFCNSGTMSDFAVMSNEEAFRAGYEACWRGMTADRGWDEYEPSEDIHRLQSAQHT